MPSEMPADKRYKVDSDCNYGLIANNTSEEGKTSTQVTCKLLDNTIQIKASKSEIDRRIASYITQKQGEVNEFNKREFSIGRTTESQCCARTESMFIPRAGSKSHIKITKVVNSYGPQTQQSCTSKEQSGDLQQAFRKGVSLSSIIEERLHGIEEHTNIHNNSKDTCARLKAIEERILFLESLSPEYFNLIPSSKSRKRKHNETVSNSCSLGDTHGDLSMVDLDNKIQLLQESLLKKQFHYE